MTEEVLANDLILFLRALNPDIENIERVRNIVIHIYWNTDIIYRSMNYWKNFRKREERLV